MVDIDNLLAQLTLEEKVSLLAGADTWRTAAIPRLNIPAVKVSDGPNGARGGEFADSKPAACFPAGVALGATFDTEVVEKVGAALGDDLKTKSAQVILAPTINLHRTPIGGRNFECYSEDPYLTGSMASAYINGVQSQGVFATAKHFAVNDTEFERFTISSDLSERALRELYLAPFQKAVRESNPGCIMTSYNKINGVDASANSYTITDILRGEWEYEGLVMSDWFGAHLVAETANAGLDLEMPGPTRIRGEKLIAEVKAGNVTEETINARARKVLELAVKAGKFEDPEEKPEQGIDKEEHRQVIRQAGAESIVLLKNENNVLPLDASKLKKIAIIGPNSKEAVVMGGGSAGVKTHYTITPYDGIKNALSPEAELAYEIGCYTHKYCTLLDGRMKTKDGENGVAFEYFVGAGFKEFHSRVVQPSSRIWLFDSLPEGIDGKHFSARLTTLYTPETTGKHILGLASAGLSKLFVNGNEVIDNWTSQDKPGIFFDSGSNERTATVPMQAGETVEIVIEFERSDQPRELPAIRFGLVEEMNPNSIEDAVELAKNSDAVIIIAGLNGEWETEGEDRATMKLPGKQDELISAVAKVNKNLVLVNQSGTPIDMPWLEEVPSILQAWYLGQEAGNSIADVLFGKVNPSGKLPTTFPIRIEDTPAYINYPGDNGHVNYGEGLYIGYRYYDVRMAPVNFPFGHGLSYANFEYKNVRANQPTVEANGTITVSVDVTNTSEVDGKEVVQVYIHDKVSSLHRPLKELRSFKKVNVPAGQTVTVDLVLDKYALGFYNDAEKTWVAEQGTFEALVASSATDIRGKVEFELTSTAKWIK
ncbi:glycoside hydrolase family 3 domain protein [Umbelopsis sp. PMI_123]|nr:glycoside hydrolase family 3 domain protein [Umbelopsis sp. PMI_123]